MRRASCVVRRAGPHDSTKKCRNKSQTPEFNSQLLGLPKIGNPHSARRSATARAERATGKQPATNMGALAAWPGICRFSAPGAARDVQGPNLFVSRRISTRKARYADARGGVAHRPLTLTEHRDLLTSYVLSGLNRKSVNNCLTRVQFRTT